MSKNFQFEKLDSETEIILIDDVQENIPFERIFSKNQPTG